MYYAIIQQFIAKVENFNHILDKAEASLKEHDKQESDLLDAALREGMYPLRRQIQSFCDTAKFSGSRLSGKEAPKHEDNEQSFAELRERLAQTAAYLKTLEEGDLTDLDDKKITVPFAKDVYVFGRDYILQFGLPNFYFHYATAYDILRSQGVDIGKRDYLGKVDLHPISEG